MANDKNNRGPLRFPGQVFMDQNGGDSIRYAEYLAAHPIQENAASMFTDASEYQLEAAVAVVWKHPKEAFYHDVTRRMTMTSDMHRSNTELAAVELALDVALANIFEDGMSIVIFSDCTNMLWRVDEYREGDKHWGGNRLKRISYKTDALQAEGHKVVLRWIKAFEHDDGSNESYGWSDGFVGIGSLEHCWADFMARKEAGAPVRNNTAGRWAQCQYESRKPHVTSRQPFSASPLPKLRGPGYHETTTTTQLHPATFSNTPLDVDSGSDTDVSGETRGDGEREKPSSGPRVRRIVA